LLGKFNAVANWRGRSPKKSFLEEFENVWKKTDKHAAFSTVKSTPNKPDAESLASAVETRLFDKIMPYNQIVLLGEM